MGALEKTKAAFFGRSFPLSITRNYVSSWTAINAIREIIQNALDSDSPFVYAFAQSADGSYTLNLQSEFTVLTPSTLLLGATSKKGRDDAIGSFGEGYKIALLVLLRAGYSVEMHNGDVIWRPAFRYDRVFGDEILVIDEHPANDRLNKGLTFCVAGLTEDDVEKIRESCLLMQAHIGEIKHTRYGDILLERPGKLYVGNLYVCDTEMQYGYNVHPKYLRLERDRQTVYHWDLQDITTKMWMDTGETDRIAKMIEAETLDIKFHDWNVPEIIKEECYRLFRQQHPGALIASSAYEAKTMIEKGLTKTVYVGGGMYTAVSNYSTYRAESQMVVKAAAKPHEILEQWLRSNRHEMRTKAIVAFKELIDQSKKWDLK